MRTAWLAALVAGTIAGGTVAGPAVAQMDSREGIALQNQILELRRDLQLMQQGGGRPAPYAGPTAGPTPLRPGGVSGGVSGGGAAGSSEIATQLLDRVQSLEDEVRRLHGQLDEQANTQRRRLDELTKQQADAAFRAQNTPPATAAVPTRPDPPLSPPPSQGGTGRRPPELAMQEGNAALARRDYPAAEASAREVMAGARGPRTIDAQFLLAQSLYGRRDYAGAAVAFDDSYSSARTGSRAPDALLGLANALTGLNDTKSACQALDRLRSEFPSPRADLRTAVGAARSRAACR